MMTNAAVSSNGTRLTENGFTLEPRPITQSSLCQDRVFKQLSGDERRVPKSGFAKQSKDSFLLNTVVGFRERNHCFVEPIGTCGMFENEARFLLIDDESQWRNRAEFMLKSLPVASIIKVYAVEKIADIETPDVMSLLTNPVWRVKSFDLIKDSIQEMVKEGYVFVEELHPTEHSVTVSGPYFCEQPLVHMGNEDMPPLHSFLHAYIYQTEYCFVGFLIRGAVIHVKDERRQPSPKAKKVTCQYCKRLNTGFHYMSQARVATKDELDFADVLSHDFHKVDLEKFTRQFQLYFDAEKCLRCVAQRVHLLDGLFTKPSRTRKSGRKNMKSLEHNLSRMEIKKCGGNNDTHSADLEVAPAVPDKVEEAVPEEEVVEEAVTYTPPPVEVVKPDPIKCSLCPNVIQPMDEVYYKIHCVEYCHLFGHKKCMHDSMAGQGLRKKKEYKKAICPTKGCPAHVQCITEYSIENEESLYLKCVEKSRHGNNSTDSFFKDDKKKEHTSKVKDQTNEPHPMAVPNDVHEVKEIVPVEVPAPTPSNLPVMTTYRPVLPPPKPNRSIPLPVDIDNVVPLVREKDPLENKYAVSEQHHKRTKPPSNKKKVVLDIPIGFRREQTQEGHDQPVSEVPVQKGKGHRWSMVQERHTVAFAPQPENNCSICLETMGEWEDVLWCPACIEGYHSQCVRTWLSTNSTCPQCRQNWPDPVGFPALGEH